MKITICSSLRNRTELKNFTKQLEHLGIRYVSSPDFDNLPEEVITKEEEARRTNKFYTDQLPYMAKAWVNEVRKADLVFFFNKNGYLGINTTLELGVAIGMDKIIIALEKDISEPCRNIYFDAICSTPEELYKFIQ